MTGNEPTTQKRWVKFPEPGEFRGEGAWVDFDASNLQGLFDWDELVNTGYLPTHVGPTPPDENQAPSDTT